jgi:hypothetical protein
MGANRLPPRPDGPDPESCEHSWRLRYASFALTGPYVGDVCDLCGALHIDGPEAVKGPMTNVADDAAIYLASLDRWKSPPPA